MTKRINGKTYSTETARCMYDDGGESLYRKHTLEYFVFNGCEITPITLEAAKEWGKSRLSDAEHDRIFGSATEATGREQWKQHTILLPITVYDALKARASREGATIKSLIVQALKSAGYGE